MRMGPKKKRKNRRLKATISRMRRHAPLERIDPYICMWGGVADIINCAKFHDNPSKGFGAVRPPQKQRFPLKTFIALTTVSALPCRTVIVIVSAYQMSVFSTYCSVSLTNKISAIFSIILHTGISSVLLMQFRQVCGIVLSPQIPV